MKIKSLKHILFLLLLIPFTAIGQENEAVWDYPVKPKTEEWRKLKSPVEIYQALQIPEEILSEIDTEALIQVCLGYPAPTVLFFHKTPQQCFEAFYQQFNGIRELMSRKDAVRSLLNKYAQMSLDDFNPLWALEDQGRFVHKFYFVELFLVQPQVQELLTMSERELLLRESIKKFDLKLERHDLFGGNSLSPTAWLMAKLLHAEEKLSLDEQSLHSGRLVGVSPLTIYQQAKTYTYE
jgi:hypothetical protein